MYNLPLIFFKDYVFAEFLLRISVDILQVHSYILLYIIGALLTSHFMSCVVESVLTSIVIIPIRTLPLNS